MPLRKVPIITGQIYHVFNRGINKQPIFFTPKNYIRAIDTLKYYLVYKPALAYSKFLKLPKEIKSEIYNKIVQQKHGVEIYTYKFMPNHFHYLVKQLVDGGITAFVRNFQISYTKYINTLYERSGALLQVQFKAVLIENDEQLIHVNRYIHLNAYTSFVVKTLEELKTYEWSSLPEYLGLAPDGFCKKDIVLSLFNNNKDRYWEFIANQADYQRKLENIKHLILE